MIKTFLTINKKNDQFDHYLKVLILLKLVALNLLKIRILCFFMHKLFNQKGPVRDVVV